MHRRRHPYPDVPYEPGNSLPGLGEGYNSAAGGAWQKGRNNAGMQQCSRRCLPQGATGQQGCN
eukprot:scaffold59497_cov19-Tisochrysis_lutea.AAC.1